MGKSQSVSAPREREREMNTDAELRFVAEEANRLSRVLPVSVVQAMALAVGRSTDCIGSLDCSKVVSGIAHPHYRSLAVLFLDACRALVPLMPSASVGTALMTASVAKLSHGDGQSIELVWTGPDAGVTPFRRTEQALLQVIESATEQVLVVSYAVYNIPRVAGALVRAADRGVRIRIVVESPERNEGRDAYNTLAALGTSVAQRCSVFLWPTEKRSRDESGRAGILHVKCAVADGRTMFLSSASLTEYAFTINMELGVLVTSGTLPSRIQEHFDELIATGVLATA